MISSNGINGVAGTQVADGLDEEVVHLVGVLDRDQSGLRVDLGPYTFKTAETPEEFEQVHELNHRTFVREIGQYADNGLGRLVDKFHDKNLYFIALQAGRVIGMIASHDQPPFSVADRLADPSILDHLPRIMEVRLFAVEQEKRFGPVARGLLWLLFEYCQAHGYSHMVISGIDSKREMYERMGFRPLGPAVGQGEARFIPMALSLAHLPENIRRDARRCRNRVIEEVAEGPIRTVSLLPGPVQLSDEIRRVLSERPVSHRGPGFIERYERIRSILSDMTGGLKCAIMVGSGTLANEVVGATIAADRSLKRGLVLVNGEFGRRLSAQAQRYDMDFQIVEWPWGTPWDLDRVRAALDADPDINWIWAAHLETSTGMVNKVDQLFDLAEPRGVKVCLDCVSSLGGFDMNISRAHLASGVSGKSIGAIAGLAFVFARDGALDHVDVSRVPTYLDLRETMATIGPRFTVSSPVLLALDSALSRFDTPEKRRRRFEAHAAMGDYVRRRLKSLGFRIMVDGPDAAPVITSFTPPPGLSSKEFCELCLGWGFELSGLSGYLLDRGIVQIATMGAVTQRDCALLFARMRAFLNDRVPLNRSLGATEKRSANGCH